MFESSQVILIFSGYEETEDSQSISNSSYQLHNGGSTEEINLEARKRHREENERKKPPQLMHSLPPLRHRLKGPDPDEILNVGSELIQVKEENKKEEEEDKEGVAEEEEEKVNGKESSDEELKESGKCEDSEEEEGKEDEKPVEKKSKLANFFGFGKSKSKVEEEGGGEENEVLDRAERVAENGASSGNEEMGEEIPHNRKENEESASPDKKERKVHFSSHDRLRKESGDDQKIKAKRSKDEDSEDSSSDSDSSDEEEEPGARSKQQREEEEKADEERKKKEEEEEKAKKKKKKSRTCNVL